MELNREEGIVELNRGEGAEREAKIPCPLCGAELTLKATKPAA